MRETRLRPAVAALACALVPLICLWGFTVDDALITARVALNLRHGLGYRFNSGGPIVDAVTPLGWVYLLVPFAETARQALFAARIIGSVAWLSAAACLGIQIDRLGTRWWRFLPLGVLLCNAPLAAWGSAGMETAAVTALATFALFQTRWAVFLAGLAAAWRPELAPWAFVLCVGCALVNGDSPRGVIRAALFAIGPVLLTGVARRYFFGSSVPLGLLAKPSDLPHGVYYCWGALRLSGIPLLLISIRQLRRLPARLVVIAVACVVHFGVVMALGGDWMPFFRLIVPVLPGLLLVAAALANQSEPWKNLARALAACFVSLWLAFTLGPEARLVGPRRDRLIEQLSHRVNASDRIAALDVGWVGAATSAMIVDLAGVTDPRIARFPGGHTSKRLPNDFVDRWRPSVLILLTAPGESRGRPWLQTHFARGVEQRVSALVEQAGVETESIETLPLAGTEQRYLIIRLLESNLHH